MPQMMPLLWTLMISFTMSIYLIIIIFIYFFNSSKINPSLPFTPTLTYWNWLW
uniref:ATP synthase F0 subunit 8 n=1 Tax=Pheidole nodus TaxID=615271 RepID=UPI002580D7D5|nr:ATP synthase F0 subunit 8 [Pheidole nodus]WGV34030.1 ATP synthase F0 subunit 8 [Pheidole nodus]